MPAPHVTAQKRRVRRFWNQASAVAINGRFSVALDQKLLRLPGGEALSVASHALAEAIAREWLVAPYGKDVAAARIPLTRFAALVQEQIAHDAAPTRAMLLGYATTDLLCYRAKAPLSLVEREDELWQPWVEWAAAELGANLRIARGVMPVTQEPDALAALAKSVGDLDAPSLAALRLAVPTMGSLVLGLALARRRISGATAAAAALLEETYQVNVWGDDSEARTRRKAVVADVVAAERFIALVQA